MVPPFESIGARSTPLTVTVEVTALEFSVPSLATNEMVRLAELLLEELKVMDSSAVL